MGGTEVYILNLCAYLMSQGIAVLVASSGGVRLQSLQSQNVEHVCIPSLLRKKVSGMLVSIASLLRLLLKERDIDLIHTSSVYCTVIGKLTSILYFLRKRRYIPIVYTMHGGPNRNIEKTCSEIVNAMADRVIALSCHSQEKLVLYGVKPQKITVIHNGINVRLKGDTEPVCQGAAGSNPICIASCGRLTEQKGFVFLLRAFQIVVTANPDVYLLILGDGKLRDSLEKEAETLAIRDKVRFLGFCENAVDIISRADIFVLPSLWEQFPLSTLEAMYLQKPIIAAAVNGVPEQIGDAGILVDPGNAEQLAKAIMELAGNKEKRVYLGSKAKQRYETFFRLETMGRKTMEAYKEIIGG